MPWRAAHWSLYALMIAMPLTGYLGLRHSVDFGLFTVPVFADGAVFAWIGETFDVTYQAFARPLHGIHHVLGESVAWVVVALHIAAALFHQFVRRDGLLRRMLPGAA